LENLLPVLLLVRTNLFILSDENVMRVKEQFCKNAESLVEIGLKRHAMLVQTMHPSNAQCSGLRAWPKNKTRNKASSHDGKCIPAGSS